MKTRLPTLLSALLAATALLSQAGTTTTLFCDDSSDESTAEANIAAGGWELSSPGTTTELKEGTYSRPTKFNTGTSATSPTCEEGVFVTKLVLGARVSNLARTAVVTPTTADGLTAPNRIVSLSEKNVLQDVEFDFSREDQVVRVTVSFTGSGSSTAYLYYAKITTEPMADPWEPVWTIGEPAPAPRVGVAFSFGVAAALAADGTPQTVSFDGLTPAAAGAQPTFSDGVFAWTPAAAGEFAAAFSVESAGCTYATNVAIAVGGETEEVVRFWEDFPNYDNAWAGNAQVSTPTADTRVAGWTGSTLYKARSAIKLGKTTDYGVATTPPIDPANGATGTMALTLDAAAYAKKTGTLGITVADAATGSTVLFATNVVLVPMADTDVTTLADHPIGPFTFTAAGPFVISFAPESGDGRIGIDSVKVTQRVSALLEDLAAPADVAVVAGSVEPDGFAVSWSAVAHADAYRVEVFAAGGAAAVAATNLAAAAGAFAGLADDTVHRVRVRAEGDASRYNFSPWSDVLEVRTARSPRHPTLSFGGWTNAVGDGNLYAAIVNEAAVSAVRDDGTNAVVALESVSPEPLAGPAWADGGALVWTPDDSDTNKTFTLSFRMDGSYATNLSFKIRSVPPLRPPAVAAEGVAWDALDLVWDKQLRAAGYAVRVWTDCPNPAATAAHVEEGFVGWAAGVRPSGWTTAKIKASDASYKDAKAPVKLSEDGSCLETYDLGGSVSAVSFHAAGHTVAGGESVVSVVGIAADGAETALGTVTAAIGNVEAGADFSFSVPDGADVRRIAWRYSKDKGGFGVGSVAIEGSGFSTPRWLPGWGPAAKGVGLAQGCTIARPRPGRALGVDPADKTRDLTEPRTNYAEVSVRDAAGAALPATVAVPVPAPPRSVRASLMVVR